MTDSAGHPAVSFETAARTTRGGETDHRSAPGSPGSPSPTGDARPTGSSAAAPRAMGRPGAGPPAASPAVASSAAGPVSESPPAAGPPAAGAGRVRANGGGGPEQRGAARDGHIRGAADGHMEWGRAREAAREAGRASAAVRRPLSGALGQVLAEPVEALTDLPVFDTSAMDGWAVAGSGPWRLAGEVLAGQRAEVPLPRGWAVGIATGAPLPPGATRVLRREHGRVERRAPREPELLAPLPPHTEPGPGQDVRPRGQECGRGERLLERGTVVTAAVLGLAAAAGYDELTVVPRPRVEVFVLGDELLKEGLPSGSRVRDALGPLLPPWLEELGAAAPVRVRWLGDDADALRRAVAGSGADLIVTTGGTAAGPVDFVHPVLAELSASLPVDGVAVRPGHPMLLAVLPNGRPFVGLPGNPLAAVSGLLTLVAPLLRALAGRAEPVRSTARLTEAVSGHPGDTRLVPVAHQGRQGQGGAAVVRPLRFHGPAMLRGIAVADGMAVIPPGGLPEGGEAEIVPVPGR